MKGSKTFVRAARASPLAGRKRPKKKIVPSASTNPSIGILPFSVDCERTTGKRPSELRVVSTVAVMFSCRLRQVKFFSFSGTVLPSSFAIGHGPPRKTEPEGPRTAAKEESQRLSSLVTVTSAPLNRAGSLRSSGAYLTVAPEQTGMRSRTARSSFGSTSIANTGAQTRSVRASVTVIFTPDGTGRNGRDIPLAVGRPPAVLLPTAHRALVVGRGFADRFHRLADFVVFVGVDGDVAERDDADELVVVVDDGDAADLGATHELEGFVHGCIIANAADAFGHEVRDFGVAEVFAFGKASYDDVAIGDESEDLASVDDRNDAGVAVFHDASDVGNAVFLTDAVGVGGHDVPNLPRILIGHAVPPAGGRAISAPGLGTTRASGWGRRRASGGWGQGPRPHGLAKPSGDRNAQIARLCRRRAWPTIGSRAWALAAGGPSSSPAGGPCRARAGRSDGSLSA